MMMTILTRKHLIITMLIIVIITFYGYTQKRKKSKKTSPQFKIEESIYSSLSYRYIGPDGNRVIAVVGEPGNSNVVYAGAASSGIFNSTDGGHHWQPIFDDQDVSSIGALAIAPSDNNVIWAGTGNIYTSKR